MKKWMAPNKERLRDRSTTLTTRLTWWIHPAWIYFCWVFFFFFFCKLVNLLFELFLKKEFIPGGRIRSFYTIIDWPTVLHQTSSTRRKRHGNVWKQKVQGSLLTDLNNFSSRTQVWQKKNNLYCVTSSKNLIYNEGKCQLRKRHIYWSENPSK